MNNNIVQLKKVSEEEILMYCPVFYISCDQDNTVMIALSLKKEGIILSWFDTVKFRMMRIADIAENSKKKFVFVRDEGKEGGRKYEFMPMTLQIYNEKVKYRLKNLKEFESEKEMVKQFKKSIFNL